MCRGRTSHLRLVKRETRTKQQNQNKTNKTKPTSKTRKVQGSYLRPQVGCVSQCKKVKRGETEGQRIHPSRSVLHDQIWLFFLERSSEIGALLLKSVEIKCTLPARMFDEVS